MAQPGYAIENLADNTTWLLTLRGKFEHAHVREACFAASRRIQAWECPARLIVDLNPAIFDANQDVEVMLTALLASLSATRFEALLDYAFLSGHPLVTRYTRALEAQGLRIPMFAKLSDALTMPQDLKQTEPYADVLYDTNYLMSERDAFPTHRLLKLTAVGSDASMLLSPQPEFVLGRRSVQGVQPHIDLTFWGAHEKGVSRCHAKLLLDADGQLGIVALDSANGTFVNGRQLEAGRQYVLREFDTIRLGHLTLSASLQQATYNGNASELS